MQTGGTNGCLRAFFPARAVRFPREALREEALRAKAVRFAYRSTWDLLLLLVDPSQLAVLFSPFS